MFLAGTLPKHFGIAWVAFGDEHARAAHGLALTL
jgi:hypothetical protein